MSWTSLHSQNQRAVDLGLSCRSSSPPKKKAKQDTTRYDIKSKEPGTSKQYGVTGNYGHSRFALCVSTVSPAAYSDHGSGRTRSASKMRNWGSKIIEMVTWSLVWVAVNSEEVKTGRQRGSNRGPVKLTWLKRNQSSQRHHISWNQLLWINHLPFPPSEDKPNRMVPGLR